MTLSDPSIATVCTSPALFFSQTSVPVLPLSRRKDRVKLGPRKPAVTRSHVTARSAATSSVPTVPAGRAHGSSAPVAASNLAMVSRGASTPSDPAAFRNTPPANTADPSHEKERALTYLFVFGFHVASTLPERPIAPRFWRILPSRVPNCP